MNRLKSIIYKNERYFYKVRPPGAFESIYDILEKYHTHTISNPLIIDSDPEIEKIYRQP